MPVGFRTRGLAYAVTLGRPESIAYPPQDHRRRVAQDPGGRLGRRHRHRQDALSKGYFQMRYAGAHATALTLAEEHLLEGGHEWSEGYVERIQSVTKAEVLAAARKYFRPEELVAVLVGPIEEIRASEHPLYKAKLEDFGEIVTHPCRTPAMPSDEPRRRGWLSRPGAKKMIAVLIALSHVAGILCSVDAVMKNRTAQGAIAWSLSLVSVPYVTVPHLSRLRPSALRGLDRVAPRLRRADRACRGRDRAPARSLRRRLPASAFPTTKLSRRSRSPRSSRGNDVELLIDGQATFDRHHRGDRPGSRLRARRVLHRSRRRARAATQDALIERARAGVDVYFVYDEIGSNALPASYRNELRDAGARITPFHSTPGCAQPVPAQLPEPPQDRGRGRP